MRYGRPSFTGDVAVPYLVRYRMHVQYTDPGQKQGCQNSALPEKRKVDSSTLSLTTSPERHVSVLSRASARERAGLRTLLCARSRLLLTVGRRALMHVECMPGQRRTHVVWK